MPLVTIVIPSLNNLKLLKKCIVSINNQTFTDYEVYIIDGNSSDGSLDYLQTLSAPFYWISEPDQGIYDAMNKGIDQSKGEWLYFLGADDELYNKHVLKDLFSKKFADDIALIIGSVKFDYTDKDSILIKRNKGLFKPSWSKKLWSKNTLHHQGVFYRRDVFSNRKYNIIYKVLADYDLNLQLFNRKLKVYKIDKTVAVTKTEGISKDYNWKLYKEEIDIKTKQSSFALRPLFYLLGFSKYLLKKVF